MFAFGICFTFGARCEVYRRLVMNVSCLYMMKPASIIRKCFIQVTTDSLIRSASISFNYNVNYKRAMYGKTKAHYEQTKSKQFD